MQTAKTDQTVDAKADPSLHWVHRSMCWFCHTAAQILYDYFSIKYVRKSRWLADD